MERVQRHFVVIQCRFSFKNDGNEKGRSLCDFQLDEGEKASGI